MQMLSLTALIGVSIGATQAASVYDFNYTYQSGYVVSGEVTGSVSATGLTVDDGFTVNFNGTIVNNMWSGRKDGLTWVADNGFISFDGLTNNFIFTDVVFPTGGLISYHFYHVPEVFANISSFDLSEGGPREETFESARWSLVAQSVPEPTTFMLIGLGLLGLLCSKHRVNP